MPWTESKPGLWQRPIGENEKFIKFVGDRAHQTGREHWSVTAGATFTLQDIPKTVDLPRRCLDAWQRLRFTHPSIACTAEADTLSYLVPDATGPTAWARKTFTVHHGDDGKEAGTDDVVAALKPSAFTTAHLLPAGGGRGDSATILLHFAHWRTDGYGALQLVNAYLDELCRVVGDVDDDDEGRTAVPWGEEVRRLTPSVEEALGLPLTATPDVVEATADCLKTLAYGKGAVGVAPADDGQAAPPKGTRSARLHLSQGDSRAILDACAVREIDVVSAVHASCAALTRLEASPERRDAHYTSTMRFSLRPYLPTPFCSPSFAAALYTGGYMFRVPAGQTWLANARCYERQYSAGVSADFLKCRRQYAVEVLKMLQQQQQVPIPPPPPPPSEVDISSVGEADELVDALRAIRGGGVLEVHDVSIGVETLTRQTYCFVHRFRGRLALQLVYNEAYYNAQRAASMVQRLGCILEAELDLPCG